MSVGLKFNKGLIVEVDFDYPESMHYIALEEPAELIQAITKIMRYGKDEILINNLIEEVADVYIALEWLKYCYDIEESEIQEFINKKENRMKKRLEDEEFY